MVNSYNYVSYHVRSLDKKTHDVQFYMETTPELAINESNQPTVLVLIKEWYQLCRSRFNRSTNM
ncbi:DUF5127 domain-containing protein [Bacteroides thetaiotaomicron]|nr:DUF5127 domain-containing protein [Bacteroides thetaiotaomicron]MBI0306252.1 DUF5127 domain-containing protein [Bacteroides thetaiotaomicron]